MHITQETTTNGKAYVSGLTPENGLEPQLSSVSVNPRVCAIMGSALCSQQIKIVFPL